MTILTAPRPTFINEDRDTTALLLSQATETIDMAITEALEQVDIYTLQGILERRLSEERSPYTGAPLKAVVGFINRLTGERF
jgi:hypothetical protein